tara:strand:+ start:33531 stop:34418 length:888 start_codon:yes stop_codon:yes gene_type:complete
MHGTRAVPDFSVGGNYHHVPPEGFFKYLIECTGTTQGEKFFGALHLYYGAKAKAACVDLGGIFSVIIRDPIRRINSLYWSNAQRRINPEDPKSQDVLAFVQSLPESAFECPPTTELTRLVYKYEDAKAAEDSTLIEHIKAPLRKIKYAYLSGGAQASAPAPAQDRRSRTEIAAEVAKVFHEYAQSILASDLECFRAAQAENRIIKMEEMVSSPDYFRTTVWPNVAPHLDCTEAFINDVFTSGTLNKHSYQDDESIEIYRTWPESYRTTMQQIIDLLGREEMESMYSGLGYTMPWK